MSRAACTWFWVTRSCWSSGPSRPCCGRRADASAAGRTDDVPVNRMRAGEVSTSELAELLSPSLFADERVVVLEAAGEAGKDAVALIAAAAADLPAGHRAGRRALRRWPGQGAGGSAARRSVPKCIRARGITKASERADFVRTEFRALKVKVDDDTVTALLDAVGSDIRELAVGLFAVGRRHRRPRRRRRGAALPQRQGRGEGLRHRRQGRRRRRRRAPPRRCAGR